MGRGQYPARRAILGPVNWRLVNNAVEAHMGLVEQEIVPIKPVLLPEVMIPHGEPFMSASAMPNLWYCL
jgi:hypothetical protein